MNIITRKAEHKVKGGKLIRCTLQLSDNVIVDVKITGDFFMHPEESIEILENILKGSEFNKETLKKKIAKFYNSNIQVIGAKIDDFTTLLIKCKE
jgi:hypothetical protein